MNFKSILFAAALALVGAAAVSTSATAFSFGHLVRGVERATAKAAKGVAHTVARDARGAGRIAIKASRTVGHAAGSASRAVGNVVKKAPRVYLAVARPVGRAVATYYQFGARQIQKTPFKVIAPFARDAARAALSRSGKFGAAVGVGLAIATGGGSLAYAAGTGGLTGYYAHKGAGVAKRVYHQVAGEVRTTARQIGAAGR